MIPSKVEDYSFDAIRRLYFLEINAVETEIPKPDGWVSFNLGFKRSSDWHGTEFIGSEDQTVVLHQGEGFQQVVSAYEQHGIDAEIFLLERIGNYTQRYKLDFTKYTKENNSVRVGCVIDSRSNIVESRWDTKVDLGATESMDGVSITPPTPEIMALHSKQLTYSYLHQRTTIETEDWREIEAPMNQIFLWPSSNSPEIKEFDRYNELGIGIGDRDPVATELWTIKTTYTGNYTIEVKHDFVVNIEILKKFLALSTPRFNPTGNAVFVQYFIQYGSVRTTIFEQQLTAAQTLSTTLGFKSFQVNHTGTYYIPLNTPVYVYGRVTYILENPTAYKGASVYLQTLNSKIRIDGQTVANSSNGYGYRPLQVFDHVIKSVTSGNIKFHSDYYQNCGRHKIITSGIGLRLSDLSNISQAPKPNISLREALRAGRALDGVGFGYELINGEETLRVEPVSYFYQDIEVMDLSEYQDTNTYNEVVATEHIYSKIIVGFEKYPKEDTYGLDDFSTEIEYQTPIQNIDNEYNLLCPYIASGYIIERMRRKPLELNESASDDYDDDNFVIALNKEDLTDTILDVTVSFRKPYQFENIIEDIGGGQEVVFESPIDPGNSFQIANVDKLYAGSTIVVSGTQFNNKTFTIKNIQAIDFGFVVEVNELVVEELSVLCDIAITSVNAVSQKDEYFTTTGIISPDNAYNLEYAPVYSLVRNSPYLNSFLRYKDASLKLRPQKIVQNKEFTIQRKPLTDCLDQDTNRFNFIVKDPIPLPELNDRVGIFHPEFVTMDFYLQPEQVQYIINCHRGLTADKYGFFKFKNPTGEYIEGWIVRLEIVENSQTNRVSIQFIKKKTLVS